MCKFAGQKKAVFKCVFFIDFRQEVIFIFFEIFGEKYSNLR